MTDEHCDLSQVGMDGELPRREDLPKILDELYFDRSRKLGDITLVG